MESQKNFEGESKMITKEHSSFLSIKSMEERYRSGERKTFSSTYWINNCRRQWLYKLACDIKKVESLRDDEIFLVFMEEEGVRLLEEVVKSEYYFWEIVSHISFLKNIGEASAVKEAISEVRSSNTRMSIDRMAALEDRMTPQQICQFTAIGVILWDFDKQDWVINPLWFTPEELAQCNG